MPEQCKRPRISTRVIDGDFEFQMAEIGPPVTLSHVQFSNGFRTDLDELGRIKGDHALVINASQSAGAFEIDVKRSQIDALRRWQRGSLNFSTTSKIRQIPTRRP